VTDIDPVSGRRHLHPRPAVTGRLTLDHARRLDAADPLASYRQRFVIHDDPIAYLDGNAPGRPPKTTIERLHHLLDVEWGTQLIRSWEERWVALPDVVGDRLGAAVLGAAAGQTLIADSTTVNLYKVLHAGAGLRPERSQIVIDEANFPTDRYVVDAVAVARNLSVIWIPPGSAGGVTAGDLRPLVGLETAVVVLSHVDYRSGYLVDLPALTEVVHEAGGVVVWDLCHSAGVVPTDLDAAGVDFAVGCTYKYLNAGPGAPAYLYVARRHQADIDQPIPGWWSAADLFAMAATYSPATGIRQMLSGTPNVPGIVAVDEGINLVAEAGLDRIRAKSVALTDLADRLAAELIVPLGWEIVSPRHAAARGSHIAVRGPGAPDVARRLTEAGIVVDFRHPDLIRLGLSPLTTAYVELWNAMQVMHDLITAP
jgi:kynureninase